MPPAYVILWFLFATSGIPYKSNFQRGIKIDHYVWRRNLSVQPGLDLGQPVARKASLSDLCLVLLNMNEFVYLD